MTAIASGQVAIGKLVRLRAKALQDARQDYEWRRDPELADYDAAQPLSMSYRAYLATIAEELRRPSSYRRTLSIEDLASGTHIGNVMFYGHDPTLGQSELGITIGDRRYWSRGYGTDAVRAMVRYMFRELGLKRIYLHTLESNTRAQGAFARAGFHLVRSVRRDGHDFHLLELWRQEIADEALADPGTFDETA
jgi:RimJ/RimL family protein N-acetyltransferase